MHQPSQLTIPEATDVFPPATHSALYRSDLQPLLQVLQARASIRRIWESGAALTSTGVRDDLVELIARCREVST